MDSRQAKDFLVEQAARQAAIEGISLSNLEKRMMYFTEGSDAVEDPISLNDEFEQQYDSAKYEAKISQLLKRAHRRLRSEHSTQLQMWNEAVATLREGDHYILVMVGGLPWVAIARFSIRALVPVACLVVIVLALRSRYGPLPRVSPYVYFCLFVGLYFLGVSWARRGVPEPVGRVGKVIARYLFAKW